MQITDEDLWQAQCQEFADDPNPFAEVFHQFVVAWADAAESHLVRRIVTAEYDDHPLPSPIEALRQELPGSEERVGHFMSGFFVGQALVLLGTHWAYGGDELFESMTPIEQRLCADVYQLKLDELNTRAAEADVEEWHGKLSSS